jgi:hypothetical protein
MGNAIDPASHAHHAPGVRVMHQQLRREARVSRLLRREQTLLRLGRHEQLIPVRLGWNRLGHAQNVNDTLVLCNL